MALLHPNALFFALVAIFPNAMHGIVKIGSGKAAAGSYRVSTPSAIDQRIERGARAAERDPERISKRQGAIRSTSVPRTSGR